MIGDVCGVNVAKRFAFIKVAGQAKDVFLHVNNLDTSVEFDDTLYGRRLEFDVKEGIKGPMAVNARAAS